MSKPTDDPRVAGDRVEEVRFSISPRKNQAKPQESETEDEPNLAQIAADLEDDGKLNQSC